MRERQRKRKERIIIEIAKYNSKSPVFTTVNSKMAIANRFPFFFRSFYFFICIHSILFLEGMKRKEKNLSSFHPNWWNPRTNQIWTKRKYIRNLPMICLALVE